MHGRRIKRIELEIDEIRNLKMYPSVNNDGMPHGSGQGDLSSYAAELHEKEEKAVSGGCGTGKGIQRYLLADSAA